MELDEGLGAGITGFQVMIALQLGIGFQHLIESCLLLVRHFVVHQVVEGVDADVLARPQHDQRDGEGHGRVGPLPAVMQAGVKRDQHAGVEGDVARVMQPVGADDEGFAAAGNEGLVHHQQRGGDDAQRADGDADALVVDRHRVHQVRYRLQHDDEHRCGDESGLREAGDILDGSVAEAVVVIGGFHGVAHGDHVQHGAQQVEAGIDQRGEHRQRTGLPPGQQLAQHQQRGDAAGGQRHPAQ